MPILELLYKFPSVINIIAIIIGWWVINKQNNVRETRKEVRAQLNDIQELIRRAMSNAMAYHTDHYSESDRSNISFELKLLSKKIELAVAPLGVERSAEVNDFRNSIMNENWEKGDHKVLSKDDEIVKIIQLTATDLSVTLEKDFSGRYH